MTKPTIERLEISCPCLYAQKKQSCDTNLSKVKNSPCL